MGLLKVENLTYFYPEKKEPSLRNINLEVAEGEFVFLAGPSGCGKSTLLKTMAGLLPDYYGGSIGGRIYYKGEPLDKLHKQSLAREIGMIFQDPEQQMIMTTVEQEVAFGLENLGVPVNEMRRRVAESLSLFDLNHWRSEQTINLSGGLKQKVILAAVLAMQPKVLILDEPTSQLDPVAAQDLLNYIHRLNMEWGLTVIMVEQRIDRCFHLADRVIIMDDGEPVLQGTPEEVVCEANGFMPFIPPVSQVFALAGAVVAPLTIKEGRMAIREMIDKSDLYQIENTNISVEIPVSIKKEKKSLPLPVLEASNIHYAYPRNDYCLKDTNIKLYGGEITAVLGENGAGKSTLLKILCGLLKPRRGKLFLQGKNVTGVPVENLATDIGLLTQNPNDYLLSDTVKDELEFGLKTRGIKDLSRAITIMNDLHLDKLAHENPRDLSGGERQRVALGTVLVTEPSVLLLDEPTRGMDSLLKEELAELLRELSLKGMSILLVTHDVEFAVMAASKVIILSAGEIVAMGSQRDVLANSLYYAPQVNRLFRGVNSDIMTVIEGSNALRSLIKNKKREVQTS